MRVNERETSSPIRKKGIRMDTEKRLAKRLNFLRKSICISCGNINEAMNTLSCGSLYEAIRRNLFLCNYYYRCHIREGI